MCLHAFVKIPVGQQTYHRKGIRTLLATVYAPDGERRPSHQGRDAETPTESGGNLTFVGSYPKTPTCISRIGMERHKVKIFSLSRRNLEKTIQFCMVFGNLVICIIVIKVWFSKRILKTVSLISYYRVNHIQGWRLNDTKEVKLWQMTK